VIALKVSKKARMYGKLTNLGITLHGGKEFSFKRFFNVLCRRPVTVTAVYLVASCTES
jgi:hypothetical protein